MKKDGTKYLVNYTVNIQGKEISRYDILEWGEFAMITPQKNGWRYQNGLGAKFSKILNYKELDYVVSTVFPQ